MSLNKSNGNMYKWVTHTWNPLGGECPHKCEYCSTKKLMKYPGVKTKYTGDPRLIEKELQTNLGKGNTIFVCAQHDLFAENIPDSFIMAILKHCAKYPENNYLFQTKNPERFYTEYSDIQGIAFIICVTIESDEWYWEMGNSPTPENRAKYSQMISVTGIPVYLTIEPIMNFDLDYFSNMIKKIDPIQVNIGFNTSFKIKLPEPSEIKTIELLNELRRFTKVVLKSNSKRIIKDNSLYL